MAPRRCCVPSCTVIQGEGVPFHVFPNPSKPDKIERFRTWVMRIGGDFVGEDNQFIFQNHRGSHRHFEEMYTFPNQRLTKLAIPSLHIRGVQVSSGQTSSVQARTGYSAHASQPIPSTSS